VGKVWLTFPQLGQAYRECCVISIFFTLYYVSYEHVKRKEKSLRLTERSTITGTVLSGYTYLLCSFGLDISVWGSYRCHDDPAGTSSKSTEQSRAERYRLEFVDLSVGSLIRLISPRFLPFPSMPFCFLTSRYHPLRIS
jgi:hypothetical protein